MLVNAESGKKLVRENSSLRSSFFKRDLLLRFERAEDRELKPSQQIASYELQLSARTRFFPEMRDE